MPRRKQHCPKRMKWEEEARASGLLKESEEMDSPCSSPRDRRNSGSCTSRDGGSPKYSPKYSATISPRESLNSSPSPTSPTGSPTAMSSLFSSHLFKYANPDFLDFSFTRNSGMTKEELYQLSSKLAAESPPLGNPRPGDSPLDLSVPRKRAADVLLEAAVAQGKMNPIDFAKLNPWGFSSLTPHLASSLGLRSDLTSLKNDLSSWNGKTKTETSPTSKVSPYSFSHSQTPTTTTSETTKALERMSELSRLGGEGNLSNNMSMGSSSEMFRNNISSTSGRTNAWQSHWLSKGQDATKDVLKCVWCKASFNTLADLTTHMKEAKHCGVNLPPPNYPPTSSSILPTHLQPKMMNKPPTTSPNSGSSSSSDLVSSIKETMPLPRKLVRGQDVWLGKGAEQTRQILKCMWCGTSFKSLAEMTRHMQQTQHYTNIISQEQIISWKSPEEKASSQTHVNAVLTCKVCDKAFSSLKDLTNHMVKYAHYQEHLMRSISESGSKRRQTREKRKKSLPVRKLLEMERANHDFRPGDFPRMKDNGTPSRIACEKCGEKMETPFIVEHIRACVGAMPRDMLLKTNIISPDMDSNKYDSSKDSDSDGKKTPDKSKDVEMSDSFRDNLMDTRENAMDTTPEKPKSEDVKEPPSVLNAIEKLIEKSFNSGKAKAGSSPLGSSILRRLGIDEATDYSKPLMDPQLMGMYATFSRLHTGHASSFNLPPSFNPNDRNFMMRPDHAGFSPTGDSDTRDTFPRSPMRPSSRHDSRPASNGSVTRDGSASDRSVEFLRNDQPVTKPLENGAEHSDNESLTSVDISDNKAEINESMCRDQNSLPEEGHKVREELRIKDEFKMKPTSEKMDEDPPVLQNLRTESNRSSPTPLGRLASPNDSSRSGTPHSDIGVPKNVSASALVGMSALLGSVGGDRNEQGGIPHPLAALQKLCDKTETQQRPPATSSSLGPQPTPGGMVAFTWACNDAVTSESVVKCAYCELPFNSKGSYRFHLSKVHFVKDGVIPENSTTKSNSNKISAPSPTPPAPVMDDSPHSKFLKYTELAKQLSSK